jgi:MscS family membrane protein
MQSLLVRAAPLALALCLARPPVHALGHAQASTPLDRSTPRRALQAFLDAARAQDYELASQVLDLSSLWPAPGRSEAARLARELAAILDRAPSVDLARLSDAPRGDLADGQAAADEIGRVPSRAGSVALRLTIDGGASAPLWSVDSAFVAQIPELYVEHAYGWLARHLPEAFFTTHFLDMAVWQWIGIVVTFLAAGLAALGAAAIVVRLGRLLTRRTKTDWDDRVIAAMQGPLRLFLHVGLFYASSFVLALSLPAQGALRFVCGALAAAALTWFVLRAVDLGAHLACLRLKGRDGAAAEMLVPLARRVVKVFVVLIALLTLLHNFGFNISTLLAGLGVGGLAVALAAQKTIENLFGGFTVVADRPVEVGQACKVGEHTGVVEDIGLRSTRLRTPDRTLVTIPNAAFADARIENYAERDRMRLAAVLQLTYATTPDQLRWLLIELRRLLLAHPKLIPDPCRVRFVAFGTSSLDVELFTYVATRDFEEFLAIREDVFLRIMDLVARGGAQFAFPSQTVYASTDAQNDQAKVRAAEEEVRRARASGALAMPDFDARTRAALDDTLDWPPRGSSTSATRS